jgi:hypothetical protein
MNTKYIHHIHPPSPFPYALPFPLVPTPRKDAYYLPLNLCLPGIFFYHEPMGSGFVGKYHEGKMTSSQGGGVLKATGEH